MSCLDRQECVEHFENLFEDIPRHVKVRRQKSKINPGKGKKKFKYDKKGNQRRNVKAVLQIKDF